jgi:hypothetical protein
MAAISAPARASVMSFWVLDFGNAKRRGAGVRFKRCRRRRFQRFEAFRRVLTSSNTVN